MAVLFFTLAAGEREGLLVYNISGEERRMSAAINRLNDLYVKYLLGSEKRKHLTIHVLPCLLSNGRWLHTAT